jgi:hypothetical protein
VTISDWLIRKGLNFFNPVNETLFSVGNGLEQCVLEAHAAYASLGTSLYAFEIGNEVNGESPYLIPIELANHPPGWPGTERRLANWTLQDYVTQWNQYATAISQNLTSKDSVRLFQGCAFTAPRSIGADRTLWNVQNAELDGISTNKAKTVSDHEVSLISILS